ncbi:hypothetical protein B0H11DRAFT_584543 [Mycena galericulata]|nr:hypothetical protein B0H11DRAFT_584543 [Mycena galericulata]
MCGRGRSWERERERISDGWIKCRERNRLGREKNTGRHKSMGKDDDPQGRRGRDSEGDSRAAEGCAARKSEVTRNILIRLRLLLFLKTSFHTTRGQINVRLPVPVPQFYLPLHRPRNDTPSSAEDRKIVGVGAGGTNWNAMPTAKDIGRIAGSRRAHLTPAAGDETPRGLEKENRGEQAGECGANLSGVRPQRRISSSRLVSFKIVCTNEDLR